jgi:Ca2+-binding EF-hand superfamily protein
MMIGGVGAGNYYQMQQTTGSRNVGGGSPPDPSEIFDKVDINGSGGLDQEEFQTLADKISEVTGEEVDVVEIFSTYDEDGDGVLSEEETQTAMDAHRPQGPPPGGMQGPPPPPPPDMSQMVSDADEDEDGYLDESEVSTITEMISNATGNEIDTEEFMAEYDSDGDGVLSKEEALAALEANRPANPPPPPPENESEEDESLENYLSATAIESYSASSLFSVLQGGTDTSGVFSSISTKV